MFIYLYEYIHIHKYVYIYVYIYTFCVTLAFDMSVKFDTCVTFGFDTCVTFKFDIFVTFPLCAARDWRARRFDQPEEREGPLHLSPAQLGAGDPKLETRDLEPGARNMKPGTQPRNANPEI